MILAESVTRPTLGPRSLLRHLRARGGDRRVSATGAPQSESLSPNLKQVLADRSSSRCPAS